MWVAGSRQPCNSRATALPPPGASLATLCGGFPSLECPAARRKHPWRGQGGNCASSFQTGAGDVRVNWRAGAKPSAEVRAGDMISCAGKGRLEVKAATLTKKGKWSVQMVRYL